MSGKGANLINVRRGSEKSSKQGDNPRISAASRFRDMLWDFSKEITNPTYGLCLRRIPWDYEIRKGELFTHPKYASLMLASKQLLYATLSSPERNKRFKPNSAAKAWIHLRHFVIFLVNRKYPILRFKDVTRHVIEEYLKSLEEENNRGQKRSKATRYRYHYCIRLLFIYRHKITDSIQFDPFGGESPSTGLGLTRALVRLSQTQPIPEAPLSRLVNSGLEYVDIYSNFLISAPRIIARAKRKYDRGNWCAFNREIKRQLSRPVARLPASSDISFDFSAPVMTVIAEHLTRLRTACFILIAFVTGMRASEILSLEAGCVETEYTDDGEFIWLRSTLHKTLGPGPATPSKWLGGPVAARAVAVLESLRIKLGLKCRKLFVPVSRWGMSMWNGDAIRTSTMNERLEDYVRWLDLKDENGEPLHLSTHRFRRTFARHVVRSDATNLLALRDHFKHLSLAMTDHYVGMDEELQDMLNDEANLLSVESFDRALRSDRLGGPRGKEIVKQVDAAIAAGRLPPEFRGEAGAHLRRDMIAEWVAAGQQVYPCGVGNDCWFRPGYALCTQGDRPVVEACNPTCPNCVIGPEHESHWRSIETRAEELLRMNPAGEPYRQRLYNIVAIAKKVRRDIA